MYVNVNILCIGMCRRVYDCVCVWQTMAVCGSVLVSVAECSHTRLSGLKCEMHCCVSLVEIVLLTTAEVLPKPSNASHHGEDVAKT